MQETSSLYKSILAVQNHWFETSIVVGDKGYLIEDTESAFIIFGTISGESTSEPVKLQVAGSSPIEGYQENVLYSVKTTTNLFKNNLPTVGSCISSEIDIEMRQPSAIIVRQARLRVFVRAVGYVSGVLQYSEWIQKGEFFVDTREVSNNSQNNKVLYLHGYDAMLLADANYPNDTSHSYPLLDTEMVQFIANNMLINNDDGTQSPVEIDERTWGIMTKAYTFSLPIGYSMREVLSMIASAYAGNFIMTDTGKLRLLVLNEMPPELNLLVEQAGYAIVFGSHPAPSYTVESLGTDYGFIQNVNNYYESTNQGISDSFAICRVKIVIYTATTVKFSVINYAEINDFGMIGRANVPLALNNSADTNVLKSYWNLNSPDVQNLEFRLENPGTYNYDIKFIKNGTISSFNDSFQFKVALTDEETGEGVRILVG